MERFSLKHTVFIHLSLIALVLLSACSFSLPKIGGVKGVQTGTPEAAATAVEGAAGEEESPSATTGADAAASPELPAAGNEITAADFSDAENPPHGLILFTSTAEQPFQGRLVAPAGSPDGERYLWAVSVDGERAGRVSPDGAGAALYVPEAAGKKSKVLPNGFQLAGEQIEAVQLPEECAEGNGTSCGGFQFSPNGSMLAYYSGPDSCGRKLTLYDLVGRKAFNSWPNTHWAYFFQNGSLILALGGCEAQHVYLYYPNTGKQSGVGEVGKAFWNPARTAVIYQVQGKPELQTALWGFNLKTSRVFLWPAKDTVIEDSPIWLADGEHFVFQHQPYKYDEVSKDAILSGPRQVILMDAATRSQRLLGYDARSSYHLCGAGDLPDGTAGAPCEQTHGNWLRVLRLPYESLRFPAGETNTPAVRCALYGLDCEDQPEVLALDWQTGKQYPWEEALVPEATATPGAHLPDLAKSPFYEDPAGAYSIYLGQSGKTLWYVPRDREAVMWVQDGENFIYLP